MSSALALFICSLIGSAYDPSNPKNVDWLAWFEFLHLATRHVTFQECRIRADVDAMRTVEAMIKSPDLPSLRRTPFCAFAFRTPAYEQRAYELAVICKKKISTVQSSSVSFMVVPVATVILSTLSFTLAVRECTKCPRFWIYE